MRAKLPDAEAVICLLLVIAAAAVPCRAQTEATSRTLAEIVSAVQESFSDNPELAVEESRRAAVLLVVEPDIGMERRLLYFTGRAFEVSSEYDSAFVYAERLEEVAGEDDGSLGNAAYLRGRVNDLRGQSQTARTEYERALRYYEAAGLASSLGRVLGDIGGTYRDESDYDTALDYYARSLEVRQQARDSAGVASSLSLIGWIHEDRGEYDDALDNYERSLAIRVRLDDRRALGSAYNNIGGIHFRRGEYEEARERFEEAMNVFAEVGDRRREANLSMNLGIVAMRLGRLDEALERQLFALEIKREIGDTRGVARALNSIGSTHAQLGDYEEAIEFFEQSLEGRDQSDKRGIATVLSNLGSAHRDLGRPKEAEAYMKRALVLREEAEDVRGQANTLSELGQLYLDEGRLSESRVGLEQALQIQTTLGDRSRAGETLLTLGAVTQLQNQLDEALALTERSVELADSTGSLLLLRDAFEQRTAILESLGRFEEALASHRKFKTLYDSVFNSESEGAIAELSAEYRAREQGQRIQLLESNRARQRLWFALLLVGVGLLVVIVALQMARTRLRKRAMTALNEAREETEEKAKELEKANELKSRFLANISHEFRTPLTLTFGPLDDLISGRHKVDSEAMPGLRRARRNGGRLLRLINQLLDLSKLDAGALVLDTDRYDLSTHLRQLASLFELFAETREIKFEIDLPAQPVMHVYDADKVEKVVTNLLSNAFKFTEPGGEVGIRLTRLDDGSVTFIVSDTGPGIDPAHLPHLFDRFYQVEQSMTRSHEGSGIGLSLVKELVDLHGGQIEVSSEVGLGTTFTVLLPEIEVKSGGAKSDVELDLSIIEDTLPPDPDIGDGLPTRSVTAESAKNEDASVILLIEDNADMRAFIRGHLEDAYEVVEAEDGRVGFDTATDIIPDLIVSDVMMPEMDGLEVTSRLKNDVRTSHIPVVLLTARSDVEDRIEGFETGADAYFPKPFNSAELHVRVRALIDERRRLRRLWNADGGIDELKGLPPRENAFVKAVRDAVETGMSDSQYSVERIAEAMNLSARQLSRKLRALTDESPANMIRRIRMEEAARLLAEGGLSVKEVSARVGYLSTPSFARAFKDVHGTSPSSYAST